MSDLAEQVTNLVRVMGVAGIEPEKIGRAVVHFMESYREPTISRRPALSISLGETFVYVITQEGAECPLKVGVSENPRVRLDTFQTGSPVLLALARTVRCQTRPEAYSLERRFHEAFDDSRGHGEWFFMPLHAALTWFDRQ